MKEFKLIDLVKELDKLNESAIKLGLTDEVYYIKINLTGVEGDYIIITDEVRYKFVMGQIASFKDLAEKPWYYNSAINIYEQTIDGYDAYEKNYPRFIGKHLYLEIKKGNKNIQTFAILHL